MMKCHLITLPLTCCSVCMSVCVCVCVRDSVCLCVYACMCVCIQNYKYWSCNTTTACHKILYVVLMLIHQYNIIMIFDNIILIQFNCVSIQYHCLMYHNMAIIILLHLCVCVCVRACVFTLIYGTDHFSNNYSL